jgi:hypothetical protein
MAALIVKHRVANYEAWKKVFDEMTSVRKGLNWRRHEVFRDAADPNVVTIVNHVASIADAKAYGASAALREGMARAGVQGAPEISFVEDADNHTY